MSGPSVAREDLTAHFHLPISDAARRLNICTTVMKKICRQHGISRWPQRKVAALNKRIKALEYELSFANSMEKKSVIAEQLKIMNEELVAIYNCTASCLTQDEPDMDQSPTVSRKRKSGFDGPHLNLDKMDVDSTDSGSLHSTPRFSPSSGLTPRNPFAHGSPRRRIENNRVGLASDNESSEMVEESPRSDSGQILPSFPQDDAMAMLLEAITSVESENHASKKMRLSSSNDAALPHISALQSALKLDSPRQFNPFHQQPPFQNFPYEMAMAPQQQPMPSYFFANPSFEQQQYQHQQNQNMFRY